MCIKAQVEARSLIVTQVIHIDTQEIDNKITYKENKQHIQKMARAKGFSESEVGGMEQEMKQWTVQYEQYLGHLRGELESAGYTVSSSNL